MSSSFSAAASVAASPPLPPTQWKHDVFISFRGEDIRNSFMSHLFYRLSQEGIRSFRDNAEGDAGKKINFKISEAIEQVRVALVVFSENYTDSKWCLNELVEILSREEDSTKPSLKVIPIFYGMDPDDVRKLGEKCEFKKALRKCVGPEKVKMKTDWRNALTAVKEFTGFCLKQDANGNESKLIDIIVKHLVKKINAIRPLHFVKDAIGVDDSVDDVISLLKKADQKGARWVGIRGSEGIGKTTVAGVAFDKIRDKFDCYVFLTKIGEARESERVKMQKNFLKNLRSKEDNNVICTNTDKIKQALRDKRIFLVLDGVTDEKQVEDFGVEKPPDKVNMGIGDGSRILITTSDPDLLKKLKVDDKYIVKGLSQDAACRLFSRHAFKTETPKEEFNKLAKSLTHYAGGHPLLLKRLGSYVSDQPINHWRKTLNKLVRSASSLSLPLPPSGLYGGQGSGAPRGAALTGVRQFTVRVESTSNSITIDCTKDGCFLRSFKHSEHPDGEIFPVKLGCANNYRTSFDSLGIDFWPSSRAYPFKFVGPFGVDDGTTPSNPKDEGYTDVREIIVYVEGDSESEAIKGISIVYDKYGRPSDPVPLGKDDEDGLSSKCIPRVTQHSIKLDYPSEYLTTISGCIIEDCGLTIIRSLTFHTNKNRGKKFGKGGGKEFSFPYTGGKIVGLQGNFKNSHLESIGAFYEPIPHTYPVSFFGPFGCEGEKSWNFGDTTSSEPKAKLDNTKSSECTENANDSSISVDIKRIVVRYDGSFIHSIAFDYVDGNGSPKSIRHGGIGGENTFEVNLGNEEHITSFAGYFNDVNGRSTRINSLTFQTNKRIWGPIGREEGEYFSLPSESGKVVGFFGTSGDFLESIGACVELYSKKLCAFKFVGLFRWEDELNRDDEYMHTNVRKIIVEVDSRDEQRFTQSITLEYEDKNENLLQLKIGSIDESKPSEERKKDIKMLSEEYLTSISGYTPTSNDNASRVITSLTFQTNKRTIGPFGVEQGRYFSSPITGGKIVGFYQRRSGRHLHIIGARFEPILELNPIKSIGPFGRLGKGNWKDDKSIAVRGIEVTQHRQKHYIEFVYDGSDGRELRSEKYRLGTGECYIHIGNVKLDYPREYLTSISGYKHEDGITSNDKKKDNTIIQSLTFRSNKTSYGPYGNTGLKGQYFWYPSTRSRIIGFFGTCEDSILTSIGVYAEPIPYMYPYKTERPFEGSGGTPWDDGVHTDVRGFRIGSNDRIHSIQIAYDNDGSFVFGSEHGKTGNCELQQFMLDFPKERLLWMEGVVEEIGNTYETAILRLELVTSNRTRKFGPKVPQNVAGTQRKFTIPSKSGDGRIVGFFGKAGSHLNSIGARLESR